MFWKAFLYGAILHLLLLRAIAHWGYRPPADRSFIDNPLTNLSFTLLGGLFVGWLGARLHRRIRLNPATPGGRLILLGGAYGIAATELTIEAVCLLVSLTLAWHVIHAGGPVGGALLLSPVEIQTYAMGVLIQSAPFGLAYGVAGGFWLERTRAE